MAAGSVTYAGRVTPGDAVLGDGGFHVITKVRRAQGRRPKAGENLHLIAVGQVIKLNSLQPVRIIPKGTHSSR